ncbi:unnamed protein product [Diatraea saccharalis]|uniref:Lipase domain-containing protein n=1 Tax=Diatraea saccharalis TaxID=40085 RepID=A0A9N9RDD3_9NEOP|nr:unnamed protein product [Diatraea saccharalis]
MLASLTNAGILDPNKLEIISYSLGGHTAGFIGAKFQEVTGRKLNRITAIDPAGFCFRYRPPEYRLDETDADFVDVIHSDVDGFGILAPLGHVDFYVMLKDARYSFLPCFFVCRHLRAFQIWIKALRHPDGFVGLRCKSIHQARTGNCYHNYPMVTNVLGEKSDRGKRGIYYLPTTAFPPYYMGKSGIVRD